MRISTIFVEEFVTILITLQALLILFTPTIGIYEVLYFIN
jgi:hypothetical protein